MKCFCFVYISHIHKTILMATDESFVDDWVLLTKDDDENRIEDELLPEGEIVDSNEVAEDGEDILVCDESEPVVDVEETAEDLCVEDDEIDSFSVLSSLSDNFSYLSFYDNMMQDVIITSGKQCYAHFRNHKLNRSLDSILAITFTLVAGLAIGNFIGLSKNCEYEKHQVIRNCSLNSTTPLNKMTADTPIFIREKLLDGAQFMPPKLIENDSNSAITNQFPVVAVLRQKQSSNQELKNDDRLQNEIHVMKDVERVYKIPGLLFSDTIQGRNLKFGEDMSCNETDNDESSNLYTALLKSNNLPNLQPIQSINNRNIEPATIIQYLHSAVDDVVHRAVQLTLNLPNNKLSSPDDSVSIERTKNVMQEFTNLVKKTLDNLSVSTQSVDIERKSFNNKKFFKTTSSILKSVDKLMKSVFEEVLSKKEALKTRLRKIQGICSEIVKKLEKNLKKDEKRMNFKHREQYFKKSDFHESKYYGHGHKELEERRPYKQSYQSYKMTKPKAFYRNRSD